MGLHGGLQGGLHSRLDSGRDDRLHDELHDELQDELQVGLDLGSPQHLLVTGQKYGCYNQHISPVQVLTSITGILTK